MSYQQRRGGGGGNRNRRNKNTRGGGRRNLTEDGLNGNSESDGVFNSAEEGAKSIEVESSEEEEGVGVVNASLIVNLSNANVSSVSFVEGEVSSETLVGVSPVEEVKEPIGGGGMQVGGQGDEVKSMEKRGSEGSSPDSSVVVVEQSPENRSIVNLESSSSSALESPSNVSPVKQPDVVPEPPVIINLSSSSEELNADSEVEKLMSGGNELALPSTVTVLDAPNNVKVYLIGTAHFSHQSHVDVQDTIRAVQPNLVLLELCSSRRNILVLDEETVLKEVSEMNFQKIRLAMSNSGAVQGVLHLLLLSMSAQLTRKLGMAPGGEFRVAASSAKCIPGCVILLGDRPFNITISRALAALTFFQKLKLGWQFLTSNEDITKEEIERCKELDAISILLKEMTGEFPSITEVFVNERDIFLAHSLWLAATSEHHGASNRDRVVVGVVGMGHVPGIVRNWGLTTERQVTELLRIPETPISSIIIRKTLKFCWYGLLGYGLYKAAKRIGTATNLQIDLGKVLGDRVISVQRLIKGV